MTLPNIRFIRCADFYCKNSDRPKKDRRCTFRLSVSGINTAFRIKLTYFSMCATCRIRILKKACGNCPEPDKKVIGFLEKQTEVQETIRRFVDLLEYLLPLYKREGKSYLSIGVGCTGGRHRSVMVANRLGKALKNDDFEISVVHRDVQK